MNMKKFKILAIVDAVLIVALVVLMFTLKGQYNDKAQASVKEQVGAYKATVNTALQDQWMSMDQYGMAWKLVYATITGAKTEAAFNANVQKIFEDKEARFKQVSYVKEVACGKNCVATFTFVKGKLKSTDYKALVEYKFADNFGIEAPAAFKFE